MARETVVNGMDLEKLEGFRESLKQSPITLGLEVKGIWEGHSGRSTVHIGPYRLGKERIKAIHDAFITLMMISKRRFAQLLQNYNLTPPQFITLAALAAHKKPCTMSDVAEVTFHDAATMTGIINRLVKIKLVQRTRSETDRRVVLVQIAPGGSKLVEEINERALEESFGGYSTLTEEELDALEQLLQYLIRMHLGRYKSLKDADLDAEIKRLQQFMNDPIYYMKLEDDNDQKRKAAVEEKY